MKLLVLSNGHGEDIIAIRIIERLLWDAELEITALPIVGQGYAYQKRGIPLAGRVQQMPSGGFIYKGGNPLWQDLRGGLVQLTLEQIKLVRQWRKTGGKILAVGDIVPLLYSWISKADYSFVGTAKSDYYLQDESGWLERTSWLERQFGSVYLPWERWLMSRDRCKAVFPRDSLTSKSLQQWQIPAYDLGNPMMDGLTTKSEVRSARELDVLLLPGSRMPEAMQNWQQILTGVWSVIKALPSMKVRFKAAIAPALDMRTFVLQTVTQGWQVQSSGIENAVLVNRERTLTLTRSQNQQFFHQADIANRHGGDGDRAVCRLGETCCYFPRDGTTVYTCLCGGSSSVAGVFYSHDR